MAEKVVAKRPYPSEFGSHSSMVDTVKTAELPPPVIPEGEEKAVEMVVCKDQYGFYETEKYRIDNNLADPNRYATSRLRV